MANINGTFNSLIGGTISGQVGTPGPQGPAGPAGAQGIPGVGVPVGGLTGQFLSKASNSSYDTAWTTLSLAGYATESWVTAGFYPLVGNPSGFLTASALTPYLTKADNLGSLTSFSTARDNLSLGTLNSPTFAGVTAQGAGANVANLTPTSLSLTHATSGSFTIQPSVGITFPDTTIQSTAFNSSILAPYALINSQAFTGTPSLPTGTTAVTQPTLTSTTSLATTAFVQQELAAGTAIARNLEVEVRNQSGVTVPAGSIVYISGATGNKPLITLAQANNDANSAQTIGFVKTSIANNGTGYVIVRGELENIDTSALAEGVQLYLSPTTAGTWTTTKPSAPQHLVYVGIVIRSHPTLGTILVAVQNGYELDELHDVAIASKANNDLLAYESSTNLWKNKSFGTLGLLTSSSLTGYATESWVTAGFYPLTGNPSSFLTSSALTPYALLSGATFTGLVGTVAATTTTAGLNLPHGAAPTTPVNGDVWTTTSGLFARINAGTQQFAPLGLNNTFSNASSTYGSSTTTGTIGLASGATISGSTKTVNVGTSGVSGSTTNITVGPVLGASTTSIGNTTAASTLNLATGATLTATTKAVNLGTSGVAGSTTNITIGSTTGTSTTTLQGTTNGVTAAADTNSVALATTAYVVGQAGSATPLVDGTAAVGTSLRYARQDHVHPTDTSRAPLASPAFTGTPSLPTGTTAVTQTAGNNTTAVATTAFVTAAVPAIATVAQVYASTSSTTATPPLLAPLAFNSGGYFPRMNFANTTSGTGASVGGADHRFEIIGPNVSTAGFAQITSEHQQLWSAGTNFTILQFSKPVWLSFRMCNFSATYDGDAQTEIKAFIGNAVTGGIDPTAAAVGIYKAGGAGSFINLMVHDGTTLTKVATTTTFSTTVVDVAIYSNNGTVNLYLNGVLAATTTAGPTGTSNTTRVIASVKATATAAVRQLMEIANIKVFAPQ